MKKYLVTIITILYSTFLMAQQLQTSSFYDLQGSFHNAAMAGIHKENFIGISYRSQWAGITGAPKTATVFGSFDLPKHQIGIAANIYNDVTGPTSRTGLQFNLAKHIEMANKAKLSLGIETRLEQYGLDKSQLSQSLLNDPVLAGTANKFTYDAGFGIAYVNSKIEIGASVSHLIQTKLNFYSGNLTPTEIGMYSRHYYLQGAYHFKLGETATITPNFLLIYLPNAPADFILGAKVEHNKTFWWGVGYRAEKSYIISAGLNINKKFTIGYCYDDYVQPAAIFSGGANGNEFILKYKL